MRILGEGQRLGASAAFLEVRAENAVAKALYEKCGFREIARRRNYYSEPVEDALVMRALLNE
jgi:ribosomal-protein-alanine N-acetyltransferase